MSSDQDTGQKWWETRYRDKHTPWDREGTSPALHKWLDTGLLTRGRVLVPGCGRGYEVVALARLGFEVTALDIAPTPIGFLTQQIKEQGLHAEVLEDEFKVANEKEKGRAAKTDLYCWRRPPPHCLESQDVRRIRVDEGSAIEVCLYSCHKRRFPPDRSRPTRYPLSGMA